MAKAKIPLRPEGFISKLSQDEQSGLTYYVISGCSKKDAFLLFCRPDMLSSRAKAAIDEYIKQFFAQKDVKDYIEAYESTLGAFLNPSQEKTAPEGTMEERKAKAKTKVIEFAMTLANDIAKADDPEFVLKMADKAGLLDGEEEKPELPRRYLPVQCGSCAYRKFCEENTEDMCPSCKYHQYGEENGIHFAKEDMLIK